MRGVLSAHKLGTAAEAHRGTAMGGKKERPVLDNDRGLVGGGLRRDYRGDGVHSVQHEHALSPVPCAANSLPHLRLS